MVCSNKQQQPEVTRENFCTTNTNEVVTYKFFTSMIPRKAFLGIPFIWFSLRSLNKGKEKEKAFLLTKGMYFSNLHDIMEQSLLGKGDVSGSVTPTLPFVFLEVCGMSWNNSPTRTTRVWESKRSENIAQMGMMCTTPWFSGRVSTAKSHTSISYLNTAAL